jgi:hypothetical protein
LALPKTAITALFPHLRTKTDLHATKAFDQKAIGKQEDNPVIKVVP